MIFGRAHLTQGSKMVNASYNRETQEVTISFSGDNFYNLLDCVKENGCTYIPEDKIWITSPYIALPMLSHITANIEGVYISKADIAFMKEDQFSFGKQETNEFHIPLLSEFFNKYPIIKGKVPYENFQSDCIKKGLTKDKLAFFLGMGSGKTYIVIQILNHLIENNNIDRILIISPPEGVVNWRRELIKFSPFFKKDDIIISTAKKNRNPLELDPKIIIMTYRHFLTMSDDFYKLNNPKKKSVKKYRKPVIPFEQWGRSRTIILDESHNIKNHQSRQAHVLHLHKRSFQYRYLLTGTPSPNHFGELYSQMKFLDSSSVPSSYSEWINMVADIGNRFSKYAVNFFYEKEVKKWEKSFTPWVTRYTSDEILDLPELFVKKIYVELSNKQKEIYQELIEYMIFTLKEDNDGMLIPKLMINKFPYISLALDNPLLMKGKIDNIHLAKLIDSFRFEKDHGKFEILTSLIDTYINQEKQKVVLFDYHPLTLDLLYAHFEKKKMNPLLIHGQNTPREMETMDFRADIIDKFKTSKRHNLLCASSKVLDTAVNLQEATRAIYFSRDYSYLSWSQSQKRLHRIGQKSQVIINPMIFEDSLDTRLDIALEKKESLDKTLFVKDSLSIDEWRKVFKGEM